MVTAGASGRCSASTRLAVEVAHVAEVSGHVPSRKIQDGIRGGEVVGNNREVVSPVYALVDMQIVDTGHPIFEEGDPAGSIGLGWPKSDDLPEVVAVAYGLASDFHTFPRAVVGDDP